MSKHRPTSAAERRANYERWKAKLFTELLAAYGDCCACCGESEPAFLTVDHIDGNGAEHRRALCEGTNTNPRSVSGKNFWKILRRLDWPPGYQILCFNCNVAKHNLGSCPHAA